MQRILVTGGTGFLGGGPDPATRAGRPSSIRSHAFVGIPRQTSGTGRVSYRRRSGKRGATIAAYGRCRRACGSLVPVFWAARTVFPHQCGWH